MCNPRNRDRKCRSLDGLCQRQYGKRSQRAEADNVKRCSGRGALNVNNWGLYFLWIPIFTGSTDKPGDIAVCRNTVNVNSVVELATRESKRMGAKRLVDLKSDNSCIWLFPTLVLFLRETQVSGNSVK